MTKKNKHNDSRSAALRENGTMNPSPEKVIDPKFHKSEFFDARDLVQVKYEMLRRVLVESASVTEATVEYGVSRPTYYETKASFEQGGLAGLVPKKPGPRGVLRLRAAAFLVGSGVSSRLIICERSSS